MQGAFAKPSRTAPELQAELDWAAQALTGDRSPARIQFALPTLAVDGRSGDSYNWDVEVSCRPEQDEAAQASVQYVADKWRLAAPGARIFTALAAAYRAGVEDAARNPAAGNPFGPEEEPKRQAWARGHASGRA